MNTPTKNITIFWYSQTGHSYTCARTAEVLLQQSGYNVRFCSIFNPPPDSFERNLFLFVFPVFNFAIPLAMKKFFSGMPEKKKPADALLILTCAGMPANTAKLTERQLKQKNINLTAKFVIRARDSYIPFAKWFGVISSKNKPNEKSYRQVENFIEKHLVRGLQRKAIWFNPLNLFHWIGVAAPDNGPKMLLGKRIFKEELCTKCGFCVALCPTGAITFEDKAIQYSDKTCIGCCGCMNICPENAWQSSRFEPAYYNKGLQVKEMAHASGKWRKTE